MCCCCFFVFSFVVCVVFFSCCFSFCFSFCLPPFVVTNILRSTCLVFIVATSVLICCFFVVLLFYYQCPYISRNSLGTRIFFAFFCFLLLFFFLFAFFFRLGAPKMTSQRTTKFGKKFNMFILFCLC